MIYVVYILNIMANNSIGDISPHQYLYGHVSPTLCFQFYKPVYYSNTNSFPAPIETKGRWVGFASEFSPSMLERAKDKLCFSLSSKQVANS